ncbi:MAG: hypothetical protein WCC39_02235 [Telluria sp.]
MDRYVTYLPDGTLDGCYLQTPPDDHAGRMIVIDEALAPDWVNYCANEARDGIELTPPVAPPDPVPVVPSKVTRRQARQALLLDGRLDDVPVAIAALDDGTAEGNQKMRMAQIEWEDSLEFERARPLVIKIAGAIGLDAAALDQLFITAAGL